MSNAVRFCTLMFLAIGCRTAPMRGAAIEAQYLHPMLSGTTLVRDEPEPVKGSETLEVPAEVTDTDAVRIAIVESARRLIGIKRSFDDRSFLGHVLRVNALLPRRTMAQTLDVKTYLDIARSEKRVKAMEDARPGDVVLFRCPSGCGDSAKDGIGAGFVERVAGRRMDFIAYVNGMVTRCSNEPGPGYLLIEGLIAVITPMR